MDENLPDVPATTAEAEIVGTFVVGEGNYDVEARIGDDSERGLRVQVAHPGEAVRERARTETGYRAFDRGRTLRPAPRATAAGPRLEAAHLSAARGSRWSRSIHVEANDVMTLLGIASRPAEPRAAEW